MNWDLKKFATKLFGNLSKLPSSSVRLQQPAIIVAAIICLVFFCYPTQAFKTGRLSETGKLVLMFDNVHREIFRTALMRMGFTDPSIQMLDDGAALQDQPQSPRFQTMPQNHFDDRKLAEGWNYFKQMRDKAITDADQCFMNPEKVKLSLQEFGEGYHALQDFYSHSNYVELALFKDQHLKIPDDFEKYIYDPPKALKTGYFSMEEFRDCVKMSMPGRIGVVLLRYFPILRLSSVLNYAAENSEVSDFDKTILDYRPRMVQVLEGEHPCHFIRKMNS